MKKQKIEFENIKMNEEEVRLARYMFDDHKIKILKNKNKLKLLQYQLDNDIPKCLSRNVIKSMEKDIVKYKDQLNDLRKGVTLPSEDDLEYETRVKVKKEVDEMTEEDKLNNEEIVKSTILDCKQQIEAEKLEYELRISTRKINQAMDNIKDTLKLDEGNMKIYQRMVRTKTRQEPKKRIQLEEVEVSEDQE